MSSAFCVGRCSFGWFINIVNINISSVIIGNSMVTHFASIVIIITTTIKYLFKEVLLLFSVF